jgi:predicted nucleic acid-binding protein
VSEIWVVNASPLIALSKIGRLELLEAPGRRIVLPSAVVDEVLAGPTNDPARNALANGWGAERPPVPPSPDVLEWGLGAGETAVLSLARSDPGSRAGVDDAAARSCARTLGISAIGTLGVVLGARRTGRIPSASEVLRALRAAGFRLDTAVVARALEQVCGETWND